LPTKKLWQNIRRLSFNKQIHEDCKLEAEDLNNVFESVGEDSLDFDFVNFPYSDFSSNSFQFEPISDNDIFRCFSKITSNAIGEDNLPLRFIKIVLPYIASSLTHLINHIFTTCTYPKMWKIGVVIPIAKKTPA